MTKFIDSLLEKNNIDIDMDKLKINRKLKDSNMYKEDIDIYNYDPYGNYFYLHEKYKNIPDNNLYKLFNCTTELVFNGETIKLPNKLYHGETINIQEALVIPTKLVLLIEYYLSCKNIRTLTLILEAVLREYKINDFMELYAQVVDVLNLHEIEAFIEWSDYIMELSIQLIMNCIN